MGDKKSRGPGGARIAFLRIMWQRAAVALSGRQRLGWPRAALCCVAVLLVLLAVRRLLVGDNMTTDPHVLTIEKARVKGASGSAVAAVDTEGIGAGSDIVVPGEKDAPGSASSKLLEKLASEKAPSADPSADRIADSEVGLPTYAPSTDASSPQREAETPPPESATSEGSLEHLPTGKPSEDLDAIVPITPVAPSMTPKQWFDAGFYDQLPPLDFGMDGDAGPDGTRAYGRHPHYMPRCHTCFHHKFMFVTLEGNHEHEIVRNLKIVMCHMKGLPANCGEHFIDQDCSVFKRIDAKEWFIFTFVMDPHSRAISSWTDGLRRDLLKAHIPSRLIEEKLQAEERSCPFRSYVMWASGLDRSAGMSCPFSRPDHQYEAIFTSNGKPAVNYVGRIEYYERDILAVLQLIDPNGDMVKYHKQHAVEFGLHEDWHPEDWRQFYKDGGTPDTWSLVGRQWEKDITWLKYPSAL
eukprot:g4829.t1